MATARWHNLRMRLLTLPMLAFVVATAAGQQPVTPDELVAVLGRHARVVCGSTGLPPAAMLITGTMTMTGAQPVEVTTWVRRQPFGFRREIRSADPASPPIVMITDGRYAWDAAGRPLDAMRSRLCFESACIDGLLYLDPAAIEGGPETREPWQLRDHDGSLPPGFATGLRTNWVGVRSPAGTSLQVHLVSATTACTK